MFEFTAAVSRKLLTALSLLIIAGSATAQTDRALQRIDFTSLENGRVLMTLTLSAPAPQPSVFTVDKPARLSVDLPDTRMALAERYQRVNVGNVRAVASAESRGRTRVVVELAQTASYDVQTDGNKVLIRLGGGTVAAPQPAPTLAQRGTGRIASVDFRRGEKGEGRVLLRLTDPKAVADVRAEAGKIVAVFKNTAVAEALAKRLDVLDFATPVKFVDIRPEGADTQVVITPVAGQEFEQVAYQSGDLFTIELQPLTQAQIEQRKKAEPQFTGERISLSFQNVDVRALLQIIADVAGTNMVISDSVKGQIAMRLENVPWDQALDIILRTKGLAMRQQGNVMLVAPVEEIATREKLELEAEKQKTELAPLRSEIIQVNYAKATDLRALLSSGETSLLSDRGRVTVDERTNTLLVLETREKLDEIRALVERLDIPVRQVLIESRIVIASEDFARDIGTRFGVSTIGTVGNTTIGQSGSNTGSRDVVAGNTPSVLDNYIVNLPVVGNAPRIAWTILGSDFLVDLELSALQTENRGEVISSPRVVTANGKQAVIEQGREIPYQSSSGNQGVQTEFKKAVLSLTVTPQITPDNRVVLDLSVTNDSQGEDVNTGVGSAPAIDTRRLDTQVLIKSGETVVLGGVFQDESSKSASKVPLLGDVPILGRLFRSDGSSRNKRELLIFVTPRVLQEGLNVK
ncbi:type IV pilus assembly protein PilQ [Fontimonas thermophila]|uniref:Type IV pilus assembly protein PilQ n=1 Tax=Fontimonas thermophila TaxID=1076937 RepID=A0A1I2H270_9GAMM|nr:type IV pilus secretin PilQ [Fontimonas thermophila]SFF23628.1 type IV pilus assembly protein PilQ [Fontimonas thermophila]